MEHISYKKQTEIVNFQGREIPLENLTPSSPRSRRRQSAGNWSSGFMRYSASTSRGESPLHDFFRLRLICGAADGIMKLSAAPFLFRKGAQNEQSN